MSQRTLVVTNDFPPRTGGIQTFVWELARRQPPDSVVVFASTPARDDAGAAASGAPQFDARAPFPVIRHRGPLLLPTPAVASRAAAVARAEGCRSVWFGATAPLGLLAPALRRAGVTRAVGSTHGHEAGWASLPGARVALRRIVAGLDAVTYLGAYTRERMRPALGTTATAPLPPGVDTDRFHPGVDGGAVRRRYGLGEAPVIVCVSRLVARKGQDVLIRALPAVRRAIPAAVLLLVGDGPDRGRLRRLAGSDPGVVFAGKVPDAELPAHYAAGDVFAMPARTRLGGLDVEGLGIVYLEAAATGRPVLAGASGGAPDAVRDGETGHVVDGRSPGAVADRLVELLSDPVAARAMGQRGRDWVVAEWCWPVLADRLTGLLQDE